AARQDPALTRSTARNPARETTPGSASADTRAAPGPDDRRLSRPPRHIKLFPQSRGRGAVVALLAALICSARSFAQPAPPPGAQPGDSAVLLWDEALLQAVRDARPGPTVVARALAVLHTAMYDAWTAYDATAVPTMAHAPWRRPSGEATAANKSRAVSHAGYRAVKDLFPAETFFEGVMAYQGYD